MKKLKSRLVAGLMASLCLMAFSPTASAAGYYSSDESGQTRPPSAIESISVSQESVSLPERKNTKSAALTPDGNLSLIDDIFVSTENISESDVQNKQFITVQSKNGNYFYLVIDRSGDTENVYLLNLVDETDLMALMEEGSDTSTIIPTCSCTEKCIAGAVNTGCEICKTEMNRCAGIAPEPEDTVEMDTTIAEEPQEANFLAPIVLLVLLIAGAGAAFYFYTTHKKKPVSDGTTALDDYDYGEDETEYEEDDIYENEDAEKETAEASST